MPISKKDVEHMAALSRLELSEEEKELFSSQLSSIVEYVSQLQEVDTSGIDITFRYPVEGLAHAVASDEVGTPPAGERDRLLDAMPDRAGDLLKVKGVFEK